MRQYILLEVNETDLFAAGYEHFKMLHASREVYEILRWTKNTFMIAMKFI